MIQNNSSLNVVDNSGAKHISCIKVIKGYTARYGYVGDLIVISVKSLRLKRRLVAKIKKGQVLRALIIRSKFNKKSFTGDKFSSFSNDAILLTMQNKYLGTRVFGTVPRLFRFTKFLKILSISSGIC